MDIQLFKSRLGAGGARPNQFLVELAFPAYVGSPDLTASVLVLELLCQLQLLIQL